MILTHGHGDHAGGAARFRKLLGEPAIYASGIIADGLRNGDEKAMSLDVAKQAGIYPLDYHLEPFPVDHELEEGATIEVGALRLGELRAEGLAFGVGKPREIGEEQLKIIARLVQAGREGGRAPPRATVWPSCTYLKLSRRGRYP